jgi:hypothetical protein
MRRQTVRLLVFSTVLSAATAAGSQRLPAARPGHACPNDAARAAAAAVSAAPKGGGGMKITWFGRDASPLAIGPASGIFMP